MDQLINIETLVLELLLLVSVVAVATRRFRVPYTVALVLAGLVLALRAGLNIEYTPQLILSLFLPPLVFEAAFHINLDELRRNLATILLLAIPGVVVTMLLVGGVVSLGAGMPLAVAMVFGALVSATDPVSVVAIFRKLGAPKRLEVLLEGESLFNDGTAIVVYQLATAAVIAAGFRLLSGVTEFMIVAGGGVLIGLVLGWLVSRAISRIDDYLIETTLTTVLAFGSYLMAEQLHVSGILAVVAAGLVNGNIGPRGMSPTTRIVVFNFWEYMAFLANSAVFLLIGLQIDLPGLLAAWRPTLWAIGAVLISRAIVTYSVASLVRDLPLNWRHILFWGGPRGGVALALALSLPAAMGDARAAITSMTFGVVLFTVLSQGMTMDWLLRRLRVISRSEEKLEYERRHARALAARAGFDHVQSLHRQGLISGHTWEKLGSLALARSEALTAASREALEENPDLEREEVLAAQRESLRAQRARLAALRRDGVLSDAIYEELVAEIDFALQEGLEDWAARTLERREAVPIRQVLVAVVQHQDLEPASNALAARGISVTRIQSRGGFLRRANHLLLIGVPEGKLETALELLARTCRTRVEYVPGPFETLPGTPPAPLPVEVKGATTFALDVERHEEYTP